MLQSPFGREESEDGEESSSVASFGDESDYSPSESATDDSEVDADEDRRYPSRERRQVVIPGAIPWDAVRL